jgi:hypothetical protein
MTLVELAPQLKELTPEQRRELRRLRREKQRTVNIQRAAKMRADGHAPKNAAALRRMLKSLPIRKSTYDTTRAMD